MHTVKSVNVLSCAKASGALHACMGLLFIPLVLIGGLASLLSGKGQAALGGIIFLTIGIFAPVFYGVMGFLIGALFSWLYNVMAKHLGGIQIELEETPKHSSASASQFGLI